MDSGSEETTEQEAKLVSSPGTNSSQNFHVTGGSRPAEELPADTDVSPLLQQAHEAFRRDLGQLLDERPGEWVAYQGLTRIGVAASKTVLYQRCLSLGFRRGEFLVRSIEPAPGEVVMGPGNPEPSAPDMEG